MIQLVIIEDLPIILEGIQVLMNQINDFKVIASYPNGKEFLEHLHHLDPDIVLSDIDMPILDGVATTKEALKRNPNLKIIALSMYNDHKYYYNMIQAGAKGFVLKQSSPEELETAIREVYDGNNYFSEDLLHGLVVHKQKLETNLAKVQKSTLSVSEREVELLSYLCQGNSNKELAEKLQLSIKAIERNKSMLMQKTNTKNTAGLIIWAIKNKIVRL